MDMQTASLAAVIFDLDGTLVESDIDFKGVRQQAGCPVGVDILDYMKSLDSAAAATVQALIEQTEMARTAGVLKKP